MGGAIAVGGLDNDLFYFTERLPDPAADRVTAVVVWRGRRHERTAPPWYLRSHGPLARLFRALRGSGAGPDPRRPHPGWDEAVDAGGPREVLHSRERRVVRVGGREYPFPPDGRTLVVLADDRATPGADEPAAAVRAVTVPPQPPADAVWTLPEAEQLGYSLATSTGLQRAILAALASDPVVRAFLPPDAWRPDAVPDVDPATATVSSFRMRG